LFALLVYCVVVEIKLGERRKESCGAKLRPLLLSHALNYIALECGGYRPLHELPEVEFSTTALSLHILFLVLCFAPAQSTCFLLFLSTFPSIVWRTDIQLLSQVDNSPFFEFELSPTQTPYSAIESIYAKKSTQAPLPRSSAPGEHPPDRT
jgi:hypothetical protein